MLFDDSNITDGDMPKLVGLLIIHVDDILAAGDESSAVYADVEKRLKEVFNFRTWEADTQTLEYCGVKLERQKLQSTKRTTGKR